MKNIIFRAKRICDNKWIYGDLICVFQPQIFNGDGYFDVIEDTIGQFVGLEDKNKKPIYEGDICRNGYTNMYGNELYENSLVKYSDNNCCYELAHTNPRLNKRITKNMVVKNNIEVIGNIYDNPELLEDIKCK